MNVTLSKEVLIKGLNRIARAVSGRSTLPVLDNILIATDGPRLRLSATDLSVALTVWLEASVDSPGAITVPARTFIEVVGTVAAGDSISLSLDNAILTFKARDTRTTIIGIPAEEFPLLPRGDSLGVDPIEFEAIDLREAIRKTTFCAATSDGRPALQGVFFKAYAGQGTFAATDGFRLAVIRLPVTADVSALIPAGSLNHLDRILEEEISVAMRVSASHNQVIFTTPTVELVSQLIEARYPDFERIIPTNNLLAAEVNSGELVAAIKAVDVFAREAKHSVRFVFGPDSVTLLSESVEVGCGTASVGARLHGADPTTLPFEIGFNAKFVMEAVEAIGDSCAIHLRSKHSPALLTPLQPNGVEMVIMPMHMTGPSSEPARNEVET